MTGYVDIEHQHRTADRVNERALQECLKLTKAVLWGWVDSANRYPIMTTDREMLMRILENQCAIMEALRESQRKA